MSKQHIIVGGGSGFIGQVLTIRLREAGHRVTWISRSPGPDRITWDQLERDGLPKCDAVVNLAGQHILDMRRRWTDAYRDEVIASRVRTTESLVAAINAMKEPPEVFVSTAGKCFYGTSELAADQDHPELDEYSEPMGLDFPAELVSLWEAAAEDIDRDRIRHVQLRIGVVLGKIEKKSHLGKLWRIGRARGFLPIVRLPFCLGLGATIGKGTQMFPWVHIEDMVGIIRFVLDRKETSGRYNAVAPGIVDNRTFTEAFARALGRRIVWSVPEWLVRALVGAERSSILLRGQLVKPRRTEEAGYRFRYATIEDAMQDLVERII
ncbi:MAG: TIGR01777 family oxidoreductase [Pseudomonadota bacterium]